MAGGKGKSTGGKAGPKEVPGKSQKSHSAKAGLQVRDYLQITAGVGFSVLRGSLQVAQAMFASIIAIQRTFGNLGSFLLGRCNTC